MDQVDKMKLTKYGFRFNLLRSSFFLSVLGIGVSILGIIGSIACFVWGAITGITGGPSREEAMIILMILGAVLFILMITYLVMWIILKIITNKQDIPGMEKIGKVYSYVSGSLEILTMIAWIIYSAVNLGSGRGVILIGIQSVYIVCAAIYSVFACLKIHGIRVENNKLIGTYLGFRYGLFALHMIGFIILSVYTGIFELIALIVGGVYFILDIGLTVILHSIRVDKENTAEKENPMKNF